MSVQDRRKIKLKMKTVRILATMFVAVLSLGFVACSDDDDEDGKKEVKVNFEEFILSNSTSILVFITSLYWCI